MHRFSVIRCADSIRCQRYKNHWINKSINKQTLTYSGVSRSIASSCQHARRSSLRISPTCFTCHSEPSRENFRFQNITGRRSTVRLIKEFVSIIIDEWSAVTVTLKYLVIMHKYPRPLLENILVWNSRVDEGDF